MTYYTGKREYESILLDTFDLVCEKTNEYLYEFKCFKLYPDLVFDFFGMCTRYLRFGKQLLF